MLPQTTQFLQHSLAETLACVAGTWASKFHPLFPLEQVFLQAAKCSGRLGFEDIYQLRGPRKVRLIGRPLMRPLDCRN